MNLIADPRVTKIYLIRTGRVAQRVKILRRDFLMMMTKEVIKTESISTVFIFGRATSKTLIPSLMMPTMINERAKVRL
jgi:hypothetical protein